MGALGLACVGAMAVLVWQGAQIRRLEDRVQACALVSPPQPAPAAPASAVPALTEDEKIELLRLRGGITRLRERHRELARQDEENAALRARIAGGGSNAASGGLPPGFVPRAQVPLAGYGTPHAAFQSLLWGVEHRDTNVLCRALGEGSYQHLMQMAQRDGLESLWRVTGMIPGYHYVGQQVLDDNTATLTVEFLPGEPTEIMVRRIDGDWRLEMD